MPQLKLYDELSERQRREIEAAFIYWRMSGAPTFEAWARLHSFYFTKSGHLATRPKHCEPAFMAPSYKEPVKTA